MCREYLSCHLICPQLFSFRFPRPENMRHAAPIIQERVGDNSRLCNECLANSPSPCNRPIRGWYPGQWPIRGQDCVTWSSPANKRAGVLMLANKWGMYVIIITPDVVWCNLRDSITNKHYYTISCHQPSEKTWTLSSKQNIITTSAIKYLGAGDWEHNESIRFTVS